MILNSSPDYETKASYNIYINVNDGANNYAKAFTVSVTNINEAPSDLSFTGAEFITDGLILHLDAANSNLSGRRLSLRPHMLAVSRSERSCLLETIH